MRARNSEADEKIFMQIVLLDCPTSYVALKLSAVSFGAKIKLKKSIVFSHIRVLATSLWRQGLDDDCCVG